MTSAAESFVIALGRASERARWQLRSLQRADRDDVTATALLWCWQNRSTYSPNTSLEEWYIGALRNARRAWRAGEGIRADQLSHEIPSPDDTVTHAESVSAAQELARSITPEQRQIAILHAKGFTRPEISAKLHVDKRTIELARKHLQRLQELMPDSSEVITLLRTPAARSGEMREKTSIDRGIEKLYQPDLGNSSVFADDYRMGERVRVKEEDIRGNSIFFRGDVHFIEDYEGDEPKRRLWIRHHAADAPIWMAEEFLRGDYNV